MTKIGELPLADVASAMRRSGLVFKIGAFDVSLSTKLPSIADNVHQFYGDYEVSSAADIVDFYVTLASPGGARRWLRPQVKFYLDAHCPFKPLPVAQGFAMFEWSLNWCIASNAHQFLNIHAAVVERNGRALILPGTPGSGKSTLSAALVSRGWRLLSDEMALIGLADGLVHPVPRPVSLKNESIDIVRNLSPDIYIGPVVEDTAKGTIAHMRPPTASVAASKEPATPACIVFPTYRKGASTQLTPVGQGLTLLRTAENSFNYHVLGPEGFEAVAGLVAKSDCYDFEYEDLNEAIAVVEGLL